MEGLAESLALVSPLEAFLDNETLAASRRADHDPTFMVEVAEHDEDSSSLRSKGVLNGHLDVVKGDEGSPGGRGLRRQVSIFLHSSQGVKYPYIAGLDSLGLHTLTTLD